MVCYVMLGSAITVGVRGNARYRVVGDCSGECGLEKTKPQTQHVVFARYDKHHIGGNLTSPQRCLLPCATL